MRTQIMPVKGKQKRSSGTKRKLAVSYAWKTEESKNPEHHQRVSRFCELLEAVGIEVLRDTKDLGLGENLTKFMEQIGGSDRICVFLSKAYLESVNCMYELLVAKQSVAANPNSFANKLIVWMMPGCPKIGQFSDREPWIQYWEAKFKKEDQARERVKGAKISPKSQEEFRRIDRFASDVDEILAAISDTLNAGSFSEFVKWAANDCGVKIDDLEEREPETAETETQITGEQLQEVFGDQYETLKSVLTNNLELRKLIAEYFGFDDLDDPDDSDVPDDPDDGGGGSAAKLTGKLMLSVHIEFLAAVGKYAQIHERAQNKESVAALVGASILLAMSPDFANELKDAEMNDIPVSSDAMNGIAQILHCWQRKSPTVDLRLTSDEKVVGLHEMTPQMSEAEVKKSVLQLLHLDPESADDEAIRRGIERKKNFGTPLRIAISGENESLIQQLRESDSPLAELILLIKDRKHTINPAGGSQFDLAVE
ncbi:MAG: toll/interleukin-1 receptor domain-containing protein, partial [Verrucomicrobiota bacterium]